MVAHYYYIIIINISLPISKFYIGVVGNAVLKIFYKFIAEKIAIG